MGLAFTGVEHAALSETVAFGWIVALSSVSSSGATITITPHYDFTIKFKYFAPWGDRLQAFDREAQVTPFSSQGDGAIRPDHGTAARVTVQFILFLHKIPSLSETPSNGLFTMGGAFIDEGLSFESVPKVRQLDYQCRRGLVGIVGFAGTSFSGSTSPSTSMSVNYTSSSLF